MLLTVLFSLAAFTFAFVLCFAIRAVKARSHYRAAVDDLMDERNLRERFVAMLAHDLCNPIAATKLNAELVLKLSVVSNQTQINFYAQRILKGVERCEKMVQNLLDANRIQAGCSIPIQVEFLSLSDLIRKTSEELSVVYRVQFELEIAPNVQGYWCPDGMVRVLENLCQNACKYGDTKLPITVRLLKTQDGVELQIHNFGKPIPTSQMVRLFEPFHRARVTIDQGKPGWGLGLTLVRGIVGAHQGKVWIQSNAQQGTTFHVALPMDSRTMLESNYGHSHATDANAPKGRAPKGIGATL